MAVAVYVFVVIKNNDDKVDITENYEKVFKNYGLDEESTRVVDIVQSSVSNFTVVKWKKVFVSWKTFFLSKNILSKGYDILNSDCFCTVVLLWCLFFERFRSPQPLYSAKLLWFSKKSNLLFKRCVSGRLCARTKASDLERWNYTWQLSYCYCRYWGKFFLSLYSVNIALVVNKTSEPYLCRFSRYFITSSVFYVYVQHEV